MATSPGDNQQVAGVDARQDGSYDEERLQWESASQLLPRSKKHLRRPMLSKSLVYLVLIDLLIVGSLIWVFEPLITLLIRNEELFGARLTFSGRKDQSDAILPERTRIPRILHQTAANETIPEAWRSSQQSCIDTYSDFEYKLWTDASARDLIASEYAWFLDTWDNYPFGIQRADALRYFVLHYYGGMYIDMDTLCAEPIPFDELESNAATHLAVFKSTTPTGVSNDLMITSAHHPVFDMALSKIVPYSRFTQPWARWQPYCAIMISAGPLFLTMAVKNYLLDNPSLPPATVQVINATALEGYITDLESASWHHDDAKFFMFIGTRPWVWLVLTAVGVFVSFRYINRLLRLAWRGLTAMPLIDNSPKEVKMS